MLDRPARLAVAGALAAGALTVAASALGAQPAVAPAGATAPTCSYDACALRLEGRTVVRGAAGARVGRLGTFGAPALAPVVAGSDSAARHAAVFDREYGTGKKLLHGGAIAAAVPLAILFHRSRDLERDPTAGDWALLAASVPGLAIEIWGARKLQRSLDALSRAVWWYNRDLPR